MTIKPTSDAVAVTGAEEAEREARRRRRFHESLHPARHMTDDAAGLVERARIVKWLQDQSEKGADYGLASAKGTTRRAAFGEGALALHRAAEAIARGDHIVDDTDGQTESQQPLTALFAPASERETVLAGVAAAKQKMQHCRDELNVAIETLVDAHVALTTPAPAVSRDEIVAVLERCSKIVDRNLYHQSEKVEDVPRMLRQLASRIQGEAE